MTTGGKGAWPNSKPDYTGALVKKSRGALYRFSWKSKVSKQPDQLRFGADGGGRRDYMRDGILLTTNDFAGTYRRLKEFGGPNGDEQEVEIRIACDVFDCETRLTPMGGGNDGPSDCQSRHAA